MAIGRHRPSLEHFLNYLRIIFQLKLLSNMPNLRFLSYKYKFQADKATNELTKKTLPFFLWLEFSVVIAQQRAILASCMFIN